MPLSLWLSCGRYHRSAIASGNPACVCQARGTGRAFHQLGVRMAVIKGGQESIDYLLMMADRALYQAKDQGRDRVVSSAQ